MHLQSRSPPTQKKKCHIAVIIGKCLRPPANFNPCIIDEDFAKESIYYF
jgi:hypothetical protein